MSMAPVVTKHPSSDGEGEHESRRKKKRSSRWGNDESGSKQVIPGVPTVVPSNMTKEQEKAFLTQLRIEEITRMLRTGDLGIPPIEDRSPSPEPQYDNQGKRLNTREVRTRKKLEDERHKHVLEMLKLNPEYKPPADYKPPSNKIVDKVFIPQEEHPEINFVGLLIGPRGNTLKMLEKDSGAKIIIRGKGSIKEGKIGRKDGQPLPGEDEPLHAYITGATAEIVAKACDKVREIVNQGIDVPEAMNDLRKNQLRELALLNGTLRENDTLNKLKLLSQAQTIVTNTIICELCGGAGHITSDCKMKKTSATNETVERQPTWAEREKMDTEYQSLMAELGQGQAPDMSKISNPKCIISRNGTSFGTVAITNETSSSNLSPAYNESSQSPRSSSNNSPASFTKTNDVNSTENVSTTKSSATVSAIAATGVVEKLIDGRKVIDMTEVPRTQRPDRFDRSQQPPYAPYGDYDPNAALMYSQHMSYYYGMQWPGAAPGAPPGFPGWPMPPGVNPPVGGSVQPPPPPPPLPTDASYQPPPPPPPPPSS